MRLARRFAIIGAVLAALALAACGSGKHPYDATAENNGYYVRTGSIYYQLQVSRELNPFSVEDHQYLTGLPGGTTTPGPNQLWYGVFLWARNYGKQPQTTAGNADFVITDTQGDQYHPVPLDSTVNQYAWTARTLAPLEAEPGHDTTASFGPTQGALLLFRLNTTVYDNRPLTLQIHVPGESQVSTISLDL
ncbi:MAG: hypothetical protein JO240_01895 [Solirubrobacterales bacterium]|nr:hypothetical protein [Solirubrobacterales bacterium]